MILVFGATGTVGRDVVARLVVAGEQVRAFTRAPGGFAVQPGVEVAGGDLDDPSTLPAALDGVDRVFMSTAAGPRSSAQDDNVATALRRSDVRHVVKLSSIDVVPPAENLYARLVAAGERSFRESGRRCTFLRPSGYMSNALQWVPTIRAQRTVYGMHGDLARALIDPADVGAVAVEALISDGDESRVHALTGPEALTPRDQVLMLGSMLGEPIGYVDTPPATVGAAMRSAGMDADFVDGMLAALGTTDPARGGRPLPTVEQITGRPAGTFTAWLAANAGRFR